MGLLVLEDLIINLDEVSSIVPLHEEIPLPPSKHQHYPDTYGRGGVSLRTTENKDVGAVVYFKDGSKQTTRAKTFVELCQLIETR